MTDNNVKLLTNGMERNIAPDYKDPLRDALHVIPQWKLTVLVTVKYPINIDAPAAKWKIYFTIVTPNYANHALEECSHPKLGALATG